MRKTMEEKLWSKVAKSGEDACWLWTGGTKRAARPDGSKGDPYGCIKVRYGSRQESRVRDLYAHRVAYELANGPISGDLLVRHRCHNTLCCNPKHLVSGTSAQNMQDMVKAGRSLKGSKNPRATLTWTKVRKIRELRLKGWKLKRLAEKYSVHVATISLICVGKTWKVSAA
jgi:hypothetical protein